MAVDYTKLNAAVAAATLEATRTATTEDGAGVLIKALSDAILAAVTAAVTTALAQADATTQTVVDAATQAITDTTKVFSDADDKLGAAIIAGTPVVPTQIPAVG